MQFSRKTTSMIVDLGEVMNLKLIVSAVLVSGVLIYSEIKPSDLLDQGSDVWERFSGDFTAIFHAGAKDAVADEIKTYADQKVAICDAAKPDAAEDEVSAIVRDINRARCETVRNSR